MNIGVDIEYITGYAVSLVLAGFSTVSVAVFLMQSAPMFITAICSTACFLLNLVLFWRTFPSIRQNLQARNLGILPKILSFCAASVIYAFSYFSFIELSASFKLAALLLSPSVIHLFSLCSAVGFYGLYIDSCKDLFSKPLPSGLYWLIPMGLSLTLTGSGQFDSLVLLSVLMYLQDGFKLIKQNFAAFASISLCVYGYGAYLPALYSSISIPALRTAVYALTYTGMASLMLCDAIFSIENIKKFTNKSYSSLLTGAALLNALANSQLSAQGKGFFNMQAILSFTMSFVTMQNATREICEDKKKQLPPFTKSKVNPFAVALFNITLPLLWYNALNFIKPKTASAVLGMLQQPLLGKMNAIQAYGGATAVGLLGLGAMNSGPKEKAA